MTGSRFAVLLWTLLLLSSNSSARIRKDKERKKGVPKLEIKENTSLCTIEGNNVPFHCFCSDGIPTSHAQKAKCWVFEGLTENHRIWSLFSTQPYIVDLNIMVTPNGHLDFVPTKGLEYLKQLQTLSILYGSIDEIHPYAFANLTKVHEIILTRNRVLDLRHHSFAHLTNLSTLDLNENRISEVSRDVFVDLPQLKKLYLRQNNLSVIQEGAFRQLGHLVELDLSSNVITVLTKDSFAGLGELKKLILSFNKIVMLGDLTFAELWVLEELDLESNLLEFISDRAFAGLTHLWRLNLSYNKLKSLRSTLLDGVPAIINFDLRHNSLETLTFDNVKPILQNFYNSSGYFYLSNNQLVCDCRLAWMHLLRNETKNPMVKETLNRLTCHLENDDDRIPAVSLFSTKSEDVDNTLSEDEEEGSSQRKHRRPNFEYKDEADYDEDDEDDYQQQESRQNQVPQEQDLSVKRLFDIALADLPCVQESKSPTHNPRQFMNTPAYAEINANGCSPIGLSLILYLCGITLMYLT